MQFRGSRREVVLKQLRLESSACRILRRAGWRPTGRTGQQYGSSFHLLLDVHAGSTATGFLLPNVQVSVQCLVAAEECHGLNERTEIEQMVQHDLKRMEKYELFAGRRVHYWPTGVTVSADESASSGVTQRRSISTENDSISSVTETIRRARLFCRITHPVSPSNGPVLMLTVSPVFK